jgi:hypothetical protein
MQGHMGKHQLVRRQVGVRENLGQSFYHWWQEGFGETQTLVFVAGGFVV